MLTKLKEAFESSKSRDAKRLSALFDQLDDPVARQTEWTPATDGGANFRTHRLVEISPLRLELRPTFSAMLFCWAFILLGFVPIGISVFATSSTTGKALLLLFLVPFGLVFIGVGVWMYRALSRPRVFDMQDLWYWHGTRPESPETVNACEESTPLDRVHAIQVVSKIYHGADSSYRSYEINLVLHDGSRVNVVDHGNLKHIRKDARKIADLIGVSVWDAAE